MNAFDQMRESLELANQVQRAADRNADQMARMLRGRLKHVDNSVLVELKRELHLFDSTRKKWRAPR